MKLQNLSVIFIIIVLPIILVVAYYMSLQADTLNLQAAYNTKLLDSTKEAIDAFEINTVEWNANYSETADSKRRDVMASINTFTNSFANNLGVSGASKEYVLANVPAIAFTLYDGYYIYSPAETKVTSKDSDEVTKFNEDNQILYLKEAGTETTTPEEAATEYKHILKPFTSYSEKVKSRENEVVINYTLDNYITLYGKMQDTNEDIKYVSRGGYLTDLNKIGGVSGDGDKNSIENIKFDDKDIEPEILSETIAYKKEDGTLTTGKYNYVYDKEKIKIYIEDGRFFILDNEQKIYTDTLSEGSARYKKCTIPKKIGGETTYIELYQKLDVRDTSWYKLNDAGQYIKIDDISGYNGLLPDIELDYSAINYCVESYVFTKWVNSLNLVLTDGTTLNISSTNDPENKDSAFSNHKREIIKSVVTSNLNQAITSYSRNSEKTDFKLPELTETDWDQILTNVSVITFVQNIPIGLKYYNNYAIATSTVNKEYVDPNEIYLYTEQDTSDEYYHKPYCKELGTDNLIGYRSIDFIQKSYKYKIGENEETKYYYRHQEDVTQSCYNCLVQSALYEENKVTEKETSYYTALARERYIARRIKLPAEVEPSYYFHVMPIDKDDPKDLEGNYKILGGAKYTITDNNNTFDDPNMQGSFTHKMNKSDIGNTYTIKSVVDGNKVGESGILTEETGSLEHPKETIKTDEVDPYSVYESESEAALTIIEYNNEKFEFSTTAKDIDYKIQQLNEEKYLSGDFTDNATFTYEDDGNIYIYLRYQKNYKKTNSSSVKAYANIDNNNKLTIATKLTGISGNVRLKFTNENSDKPYYSKDIFKVEDGDIIYCKIDEDTSWYLKDWTVSVWNIDNTEQLAEGSIEFYTIDDNIGLNGFSNAVNNRAKTKDREFYLVNNITMSAAMNPIAQGDRNSYNLYFDGVFSGQYNVNGIDLVDAGDDHSITNLTINVDNAQGNHYAFGLFGWVGKDGTIRNLNINNIKVQYTGSNNDIKLGGLAGYCDTGAGISNIKINGGTITGGTYTGGIVGKSDRIISNCTVSNISSLTAKQYAGGIVGYTTKSVSNSNVSSVTTLTGEVDVGGIAGYITGSISNSNVSAVNTLRGGAKAGGIAGYIAGSISNSNVSTVNTLGGGSDTGGIAGYITGSSSNCTVNTITTLSGIGSIGGIAGYTTGSISNSNVSNVTTLTGEGNVGGIVGNTPSTVSTCNVSGVTTLKGTESVGGIAGFIRNSITNCNASITTIRNADFTKDKHYQLYIGGIAGYTTGNIQSSSITATNIGAGDVKMKKSSNKVSILGITVGGTNKYGVGGIAGYTSANITGTTLNSSVQIKGGKVSIGSSTDDNAFNCTGGRVGYKASSQQADSSWKIDCYVSGYDNVGGIIGYNANGNITGITRGSNVYGAGENVGGIVGLNQGGAISNCTNNATVTGVSGNLAENVGGIVGLNSNRNITKCYNKKTVTGDKNVGGIAGVSYGGSIQDCGNSNSITGKNNTNRLNIWYYTGPEDCTGTGGITGKNYRATITRCYNNGNVICNFNGGGITGLINGGKIEYSYNTASITNSQETTALKSNRLGGIAGAGNEIYINSCYNIGAITGRQDTNILSNGMGGIIGTVVDNSWFWYIGETELFPSNKYIGEIKINTVQSGQTQNSILNCYNTGNISGGCTTGNVDFNEVFKDFSLSKLWDFIRSTVNPNDAINHMCGIAGTILWAPNSNNILLQNNYYFIPGNNNVVGGARSSWSNMVNGGITKASSSLDMKYKLYNWASKAKRSRWTIL